MTALRVACSANDGVLFLDDVLTVATYPAPYSIGSEVVNVVGGSGTPNISVNRGIGGSSAAAHDAGAALTAANAFAGGGAGGIDVTDGTTTVAGATSLSLPAGTVSDAGGGAAAIGIPITTRYRVTEQDANLGSTGVVLDTLPAGAIVDVSAVFRVNFDATGWIVVGIDDGSGGTWLVWSLPALSDITQTFPDGTTTASLAQSNDPSTFSNGQALPAVVSATPRELLAQVQSPNASGPGIVDFYVTVTQPAGE